MSHLPILPILIPALAGFVLLLLSRAPLVTQRWVSFAAAGLSLLLGIIAINATADGTVLTYELGAWEAPFGIILVLDRLSALMVLLTTLVAVASLWGASRGWDGYGNMFHALFQFQIMGIQGAFLTGDIFNLFVFFEILLIASYGLLMQGQSPGRTRASIKYVVVNLVGSALFLVGVGILYGLTGTLNMADLAVRVPELGQADAGLVQAGALILLVVFGIKAAMLPLYFWLPDTYSNAIPPVAALFAIMSKIGVYAILRVYTLAFGPDAGVGANVVEPWLMPLGLATLTLAMLGAISAPSLARLVAYLTIGSVGTLLVGIGLFSVNGIAGSLYYLVHSTLATAGLFLLVGLIGAQRGKLYDQLRPAPAVAKPALLGLLFMGLAVAIAGLPPLSGFLGKLLILAASIPHTQMVLIWAVVLVTSLFAIVSLSRAGSMMFWKVEADAPEAPPQTLPQAPVAPVMLMLGAVALFTIMAGPVDRYVRATAEDLMQPTAYINAVLPGHNSVGGAQ